MFKAIRQLIAACRRWLCHAEGGAQLPLRKYEVAPRERRWAVELALASRIEARIEEQITTRLTPVHRSKPECRHTPSIACRLGIQRNRGLASPRFQPNRIQRHLFDHTRPPL